ncbi:hypothetical protein BD289DRAFT_453721 [Coniella lustricola]|uniref:Uncharacterized protein n=1 Tax=Coniella lustricola TaxID=2025994 RepID=A0A2T3A6G3_9PEZI|nr:hypothetical protein BD289DRAFT_453721 [Coniella lustricola]
MRMTGNALCRVWSRVPGLSEHWCMQIQWRIGLDDEIIAALTEPRYPCADESLDTIILTQTIYLCQLLLHLQEFDPCTGVAADDTSVDDELLRVFQDSVAREYNVAYDTRVRDGPAPDGEALERLVRGLMKAELDGPQANSPTAAAAASRASIPPDSPVEETQTRLQQVLADILHELNAPLWKRSTRYEQQYGRRTDATWAARYATRIMQWRHVVREDAASLVRGVVEVQKLDVAPLDEEGMQVYQILRNAAPGRIHLATPVQPEIPPRQRRPLDHGVHQGPLLRNSQHQYHQHKRSVSSGMKVQQMLATPLAQTPMSTPSQGSDTPRTTPQNPSRPHRASPNADSGTSAKRISQDLGYPPAKRLQLMVPTDGEGRKTEVGTEVEALTEPKQEAEGRPEGIEVEAGGAEVGDIPIRGGPLIINQEQQGGRAAAAGAQDVTLMLRRILDGVAELGRRIDSMQEGLDQKMEQLDERLQRISESLI